MRMGGLVRMGLSAGSGVSEGTGDSLLCPDAAGAHPEGLKYPRNTGAEGAECKSLLTRPTPTPKKSPHHHQANTAAALVTSELCLSAVICHWRFSCCFGFNFPFFPCFFFLVGFFVCVCVCIKRH